MKVMKNIILTIILVILVLFGLMGYSRQTGMGGFKVTIENSNIETISK